MDPKDFRKKKAKLFLFIPLVVLAVSGIVMLLWNAILPDLLGVKHINFWQSAGLLVLCKILFGGFNKGPGGGGMDFKERWMNRMGDEERQRIREEWKKRCSQWRKDD